MDSNTPTQDNLAFLDYELRPAHRLLFRDGKTVAIGGRAFDLLVVLVSQPGRVLSIPILMRGVWRRSVVSEANLRVQINTLRKLLGDRGPMQPIVTVAGRGYCFTAPVRQVVAGGERLAGGEDTGW